MLLHISPHLQRRIEEAGFVFGSGSLEVWLVERATLLRDLLTPVAGLDVLDVLRRGADLESVMVVPAAERTTEQRRDRDLLLVHQAAAAPALARALVQARARFGEIERERDVAVADVARLTPPRLAYELSVAAPPRPPGNTCNKHGDCEAADREAEAAGKWRAAHCHDETCEDCLGS